MHILTAGQGWLLVLIYGAVMLALVLFGTSGQASREAHFLANRKVGVIAGALSIAVTWIWAPAIFFCGMKAYQEGLPGAFWFTVPNVLCFVLFAVVALKIRELSPDGYSLPDFLQKRFNGERLPHLAALSVVLIIDFVAIIFNCLVGAYLLMTVAGVPFVGGAIAVSSIALLYSIWRGLPASIVTDVVQMLLILVICFLVVPWVVHQAGGFEAVLGGLGGKSGEHNSIFETSVSFSWGIPASISLLAVPLVDQMFYQRAFATERRSILPTFILGGLLFGIVPVLLSSLGFLAANPQIAPLIKTRIGDFNPLMVNAVVVANYLPSWSLVSFALLAICAISSTLDSAYCAVSSLIGIDIYQRYVKPDADDAAIRRVGDWGTVMVAAFATLSVILLPLKGEWLFNINGSVAACVVGPLLLTVFTKRVNANGFFWAVVAPLVILGPYAIWANVMGEPIHIVAAMSAILILSSVIALLVEDSKQ